MTPRQLLLLCCLVLTGPAWPATDAIPLPPGVMAVDGTLAPALRLNSLDSKPYDLSGARGHWVFVHFWATWCGPCKREMPAIQRMITRLQTRQIEFIMVNTAETGDEVFAFLAAVAPDVTPLMDTQGLVTEQWQPRGLPASFLVDPQGRIRYQALGGREWDTAPYLDFLHRLEAD
jgi:cytochrome c biogenesis protein CcmG/thiol:disulfide interchange protein DsbE